MIQKYSMDAKVIHPDNPNREDYVRLEHVPGSTRDEAIERAKESYRHFYKAEIKITRIWSEDSPFYEPSFMGR